MRKGRSTISVEQELLHILFIHGYLLQKSTLTSEDFTQQTDKIIYQSMIDVASQNKPIDLVSVAEHIENKYRKVDMEYMGHLVEKGVGTPLSFDNYVDIIRKNSRNRKAKQIAWELQNNIDENLGDDDPIQNAVRQLMEIDRNQQSFDRTINECLEAGLNQVQEAMKSEGLVGITTGLTDLDDAIGGYHETDLYVVGARPAMGKTAFLFSSALANNKVTGIISAEQGFAQAGLRCIAIAGSVNSQNLRSAKLDETEWAKVTAGTLRVQDRPIFVNDEPGINITNLVRQARMWKFNHGLEILFVDYIQKIKGSNTRANKTEQVTEVVNTLKQLARELEIPVVALAQVKREVESRPDKRPKAGDMSDATAIEQEADCIFTLYRDEVYFPDTEWKGVAEIDAVKNRHGPIGLIKCIYEGRYFQFKDFNSNEYMGRS